VAYSDDDDGKAGQVNSALGNFGCQLLQKCQCGGALFERCGGITCGDGFRSGAVCGCVHLWHKFCQFGNGAEILSTGAFIACLLGHHRFGQHRFAVAAPRQPRVNLSDDCQCNPLGCRGADIEADRSANSAA
jgi:hypothetical protein